MEYKIIKADEYNNHKQLYLELITELFKNENDRIANLEEITKHLDFIFNNNYNSF